MFKNLKTEVNMRTIAMKVSLGSFNLEHPMQRGIAWDVERRSLFIHSILIGLPLPLMYGVSEDHEIISIMDGKQRCLTIHDFCHNKFALKNVPPVTYLAEDGETTVSVNNLTYSQLPEGLVTQFNAATCTLYNLDGMTEEEIGDMFYRLNNGKKLTAVEQIRARAKSKAAFIRLADHKLFESILTKKALESRVAIDIAMKSFILMTDYDEPMLDSKSIDQVVSQVVVDEDMENALHNTFSRMLQAMDFITVKRVKKSFYKKTHLLSFINMTWQSIVDVISIEDYSKWVISFFDTPTSVSTSQEYNDNYLNHTTDKASLKRRLHAVRDSYYTYFKKK